MSKYAGSITIVDEAGNIVFERELTSDELIEALLTKRELNLSGEGITVGAHNIAEVFEAAKKTLRNGKIEITGKAKLGKVGKISAKPLTGNGRMEEIAALFNEGLKAAEVAKKLKIDISLVYANKSKAKKAGLLNTKQKNTEEKTEAEIDVATERSVKDLASMGWTVKAIAEETDLSTAQVLRITKATKHEDR